MSALNEVESDPGPTKPLSKNQQKKQKRDEEWEAGREERKIKRRERNKVQRIKKRTARQAVSIASSETLNSDTFPSATNSDDIVHADSARKSRHFTRLPITFLLDCDFDELMSDKERTSLASQLTRCYSENHKAPFQAHLAVSSFNGKLKERFDGILAGNYRSWKNITFSDDDFVEASKQADVRMQEPKGGTLAGVFSRTQNASAHNTPTGEVVYLSSDSSDTLTQLKPYSTYIIGGLVDRNKHKGICYKRAMERGVKTAKLPIGDFMKMNSRFVLATNHVVEIMLQWLELGDWAEAFLRVIPKRKGGTLKQPEGDDTAQLNIVDNEAEHSDGSSRINSDMQAPETVSDCTLPPDIAKEAVKSNEAFSSDDAVKPDGEL